MGGSAGQGIMLYVSQAGGNSMHSLQIKALGPAISFFTSNLLFPQKEHM